jgi:hypothetical protein
MDMRGREMTIEIMKGNDNPVAEFFSSPSNTPETDGYEIIFSPLEGDAWVPASISRKLERERDEARQCLKEIEEYGTEEINAAIDLRRNLAQALVDLDDMQYQRDEARELLASEKITRDHVIKRGIEMQKERDEARDKITRQAERIRELEGATNHAGGLHK